MSIEHKSGLRDGDELEESVTDYLVRHPEFFESHGEVLAKLKVPHPTGRAVSLIERQVRCCASSTVKWNASWWT